MPKKVSVIVVNFNGMSHIETCITSLLNQTYRHFEVIFVDNNSSDGSLQYAQKKSPQLIFVQNDKNLGYAGGINSGLACATGDYIAPLNIDTEVTPNWLGAMVSFLDANPQVAAVTPKILLFYDRSRINVLGLNIHVTALGFCRQLGKPDDGSINPEKVSGVSGCSYLIRREILERMGGAPEECFMGNDDVIVSWLVSLMDYDMYCVPEAVIYHKYMLKMSPERLYTVEKNRQALLLSTLKPLTFVACFPIFLVVEILIIGYCTLKGMTYLKAKFSAFSSLWKEKNSIKQKRVRYMHLRKVSDFELLRRLRWNLDWAQLWRILK
jgi:GT2 family glycosyltransferase